MNNYKSKAINLHAEVYGWLYRALEEMIKAEWHNDELFKVWLNRAEFLVRQSKKLHTACENDYSKRALIKALQLKVEINEKISSTDGFIVIVGNWFGVLVNCSLTCSM